ncbi:YfhO family protein [Salinicoccus carnicancri]|uniref:YfhO family protein n=1 Tax=Salinicoccus carnicancri TaxID=558170 RepID=UPI00031F1BFD|nr:YfhO family protein [Salinicoccus carnicancri]
MKKLILLAKRFRYLMLIAFLAILSHAYVLWRLIDPDDEKQKIFMTGANDGLEQMLPMQLYLYEKFKEGTLFFDMDFGLGGDFYTDLAYYYSTNVIYHINVIFVRIGEFLFGYDTGTVEFWALNGFFISIMKTFAIIFFTYKFLKIIGVRPVYAVLGGFIFAASPTYFRFTIFWSFFSDVFIWLPLTFLALELLIRKGRPALLVFAVALTLINNFYFAYFQLIISVVYLVIRLCARRDGELRAGRVLKLSIPSAIIGFGISTVAFFHAVRGFLNNDSREYMVEVPFIADLGPQDNIFYENYLVVILFLAVQALFTPVLYRNYYYKLFALLTIVFMIFTVSPYVDTFFNGFQQPQKRWHYMLVFFHGVLIAQYLSNLRQVPLKTYALSMIPVYILLGLSVWIADEMVVWLWLVPLVQFAGLAVVTADKERRTLTLALAALVIIFTGVVSASHTDEEIYHPGITDRNHLFYINSNHYRSELQQYNIDHIKKMKEPEQKIDYRVREQDNTPMYMRFSGTSMYSSIINGEIIDFYYNDLKVNFTHESISRYASFQSRNNLYSLFSTDYLMREEDAGLIPSRFRPVLSDGTYTIHENMLPLDFIRFSDRVYDPDDLTTPLQREHAMLEGVVTDAHPSNSVMAAPENVLDEVGVEAFNADFDGQALEVHDDGGGLRLDFSGVPDAPADKADVYIELHIELVDPVKRFTVDVDGYQNDRLFATSKYRTYADDLLYRAEIAETIPIQLSSGEYEVDIEGIYIEDYSRLEDASHRSDVSYEVTEHPNSYEITLDGKRPGLAVVPIMYRDGMTVTGNDSGDLGAFRANYLMTAFEVGPADTSIRISYTPPYYWITLIISALSLLGAFIYVNLFGVRKFLCRFMNRRKARNRK